MYFVRLIYTSRPGKECTAYDVIQILQSSRKNNPERGITGLLVYDRRYFLQWIEGPRDNINKLFMTISKDTRHDSVVILDYGYIHSRQFSSWDMAYISSDMVDDAIISKYKEISHIEPSGMSGEGARLMLLDIHEKHKAVMNDKPTE